MFRAAFLLAFLSHVLADYEFGGCNGYGCTYGKTQRGPGGVGSTVVSTGGSGSLNYGLGLPNVPFFGIGPSSASSGSAASGLGGAASSSAAASGGPFGGAAASSAAAVGSSQPGFQYQLDPSFVGTGFQGFQSFQQFGIGGSAAAGAAASGDDGAAAASAAAANGAGSAAASAAAVGSPFGFPGRFAPAQVGFPTFQPRLPSLLPGIPTRPFPRYPPGVGYPRVPVPGRYPFRYPARKPFVNKKKVNIY
ncbi:spidroin-2-like [Saccostrea cucullata]|uniref:spidroin-2-like n=1 Tax=Saccostrea cuccullata TaxID=36930 RepID=UPI002ED4B737